MTGESLAGREYIRAVNDVNEFLKRKIVNSEKNLLHMRGSPNRTGRPRSAHSYARLQGALRVAHQ